MMQHTQIGVLHSGGGIAPYITVKIHKYRKTAKQVHQSAPCFCCFSFTKNHQNFDTGGTMR